MRELSQILRGRTALLNVIPYNPVAGLPYGTPSQESQATFRKILEASRINVRFRQRKGDRIDAACGQLRRSLAPSVLPTVELSLAGEEPSKAASVSYVEDDRQI